MPAFATSEQLGKRLKRTFTPDERTWLDSLLEDATEYLRGIIGAWVAPARQSTYTAYPIHGEVVLPQSYVVSVDAVKRDGEAVTFTRFEDTVRVRGNDPVDITFTYGTAAIPSDLTGFACAIVSNQITTVEAQLGISVGGLSSVALDDFKLAFADAGEMTGLALPAHSRDYLRTTYGTTAWTVNFQ